MIIKYKTDYFGCSLSTMKKFNEQLQKTIVNITVRRSRQSGVARATCPD